VVEFVHCFSAVDWVAGRAFSLHETSSLYPQIFLGTWLNVESGKEGLLNELLLLFFG